MSNPKKEFGTTRHLGIPNKNAKEGYSEYLSQINSFNVKPELSYVNMRNGGHVVWEKGHLNEKDGKDGNEFKFAKALADKGYWVHLLPERDVLGAISLRLGLKGDKTFIDGKVKSLTGKALYEQWSPTKANMKYGILAGLEHASDKGCRLLALYDPTNILSRDLVKLGMEKYNEGLGKKSGYIKLDGVLTYNADGQFNSWYWDDLVDKK